MRPEGWEKPYKFVPTPTLLELSLLAQTDLGHFVENETYEAGADAMLEGLKKEGEPVTIPNENGFYDITTSHCYTVPGYLVFIEEE